MKESQTDRQTGGRSHTGQELIHQILSILLVTKRLKLGSPSMSQARLWDTGYEERTPCPLSLSLREVDASISLFLGWGASCWCYGQRCQLLWATSLRVGHVAVSLFHLMTGGAGCSGPEVSPGIWVSPGRSERDILHGLLRGTSKKAQPRKQGPRASFLPQLCASPPSCLGMLSRRVF